MAAVRYARGALGDLERLTDFLLASDPVAAAATTELILEAVEVLGRHPKIGRPGEGGFRELVISRGKSGYVALYRYDEARDVVVILAVRHQREAGISLVGSHPEMLVVRLQAAGFSQKRRGKRPLSLWP